MKEFVERPIFKIAKKWKKGELPTTAAWLLQAGQLYFEELPKPYTVQTFPISPSSIMPETKMDH